MDSLLQMRMLMEPEFARYAARHRTEEQVQEFHEILQEEESADHKNVQKITDLDFEFHLLIALASGNVVFPLLLNSFRQVYTNLSGQFFKDSRVINTVHKYHRVMIQALELKDEKKAISIMKTLLDHGEKYLRKMIVTLADNEAQVSEAKRAET
jgi:GntR family negative regulator for fad regulon and positive regulator of fabA